MTTGQHIDEISERINYVMSTKESAVQQTLMLTEESLSTLDNLKIVLQMQTNLLNKDEVNAELLQQITQAIEAVQHRLTEMLMVQSYQDITGQVLQQVLQDLQQLDRDAQLNEVNADKPASAGFGPAVLADEKQGRAKGQQDVDDLLAEMGL
ncbi:MAG: protein phosphatase CheZ [Gammaproteobacteria bacterium]|nr:protein phosphatase CheZ [Gammaproteobacteria bacterium]HQR82236.1 protein phosphatase CheZ [Thiotrichales bacterium]HQR96675.1 protein phosphatase CheZ [Thiotrichales bacterium]HQT01904.1 protein phosphatase CheZ [Thiotrichales bacterium]HQT04146.1 protein phosphatase CheZ [Thiotrichales bacterium]